TRRRHVPSSPPSGRGNRHSRGLFPTGDLPPAAAASNRGSLHRTQAHSPQRCACGLSGDASVPIRRAPQPPARMPREDSTEAWPRASTPPAGNLVSIDRTRFTLLGLTGETAQYRAATGVLPTGPFPTGLLPIGILPTSAC